MQKNFGLRNLSFQESSDLLLALCENVVSRLLSSTSTVIDKATLKLKLAGDDWVEPKKRGGIGDAYDFSRTCTLPPKSTTHLTGAAIHALLIPIIASSEIDTTRIRGIGVSLKLGTEDTGKRQKTVSGQLDKWFAGENFGGGSAAREIVAVPVNESRDDQVVITDTCLMCGDEIPVGSLTNHFLAAHRNDEICLCPICKDPIEVTDVSHVASHFGF